MHAGNARDCQADSRDKLGSRQTQAIRQGEIARTTAAAADLSTPTAKAVATTTASGASRYTVPSPAPETPGVAAQNPVVVPSWQRPTSTTTADTLGSEHNTLGDESLELRGTLASEAREPTNIVVQVESRSANRRNDVLANSSGQDEEQEETNDCDGDVGTDTIVNAPYNSGVNSGVDAGAGAGAGAHHNRRSVTEATSDTKQAEGGWAFATSAVSGAEIDRGNGEPVAAVATVGLFGKDKRPQHSDALSVPDDEEEGEGRENNYGGNGHSRTGDEAVVNAAGDGATWKPDDSLASSIPAETHIRPMPSFSSSDASVVDEQLLEDFGEDKPRMSSTKQLPDKSGDRHHAAVKEAAFTDREEDDDQEKFDAGATRTAKSVLAMLTPVVTPREELAESASMSSSNTAAAGGLAAQASVGRFSEWDDDDHNGGDSGTDEGRVPPSFEPRPTSASDFLDGSTRNASGRGSLGAVNSRGVVTSDLDGGVVESTAMGTAGEVATEEGVEGKLADDGQGPTAMLSVVGDPEVWVALLWLLVRMPSRAV
ncbi:unnamed protein product [Ectocarpus sp. CCAP 1310/34]|nr:unnamed protein product [Ectocarpus sp. CCAP 1310/34]